MLKLGTRFDDKKDENSELGDQIDEDLVQGTFASIFLIHIHDFIIS